MAQIENEIQYKQTMTRIEELLAVVDDNTPADDKNAVELALLSNLVADYDELHYPISTPSLPSVLRQKMYELHLTQNQLAEKLNVSPARMSEYMTGKREPTLPVARNIVKNLSVSPNVVLGL